MTTTLQTGEITPPYDELAVTSLNPKDLEPWVSMERPSGKLPRTTLDLGSVFFDLALWTKTARPHPITPNMGPGELASLREAIREFGLVGGVIYVNQRGVVVDGYHRMLSILELLQEGVALPVPEVRFIQFRSDQDELAFVLMMNVTRRMLDDDQKEEVLKKLLRSGHDGTDKRLSDLCGLGDDKVRDVRAMLECIPVDEGGIPFLPLRRSEAGKSYPQKRRKPESKKRRENAGLIDKLKTKANPKKVMPTAVMSVNEVDTKLDSTEQERDEVLLDEFTDLEVAVEPRIDDDTDEDADLVLLIRSWWQAYRFLPVMSRELAALGKDTPPSKGDADAITRRLKPQVGSEFGGHLILHRKMAAGVSAFLLFPVALCDANGIDKELLIRNAGTV